MRGQSKTMEVGVLTAPGKIEMRRANVPELAAGELLVRVEVTCLCGSDLAVFRGAHPYKRWPAVLGHELAGVVCEVGAGVGDFRPGDRVCAASFAACGECDACLGGRPNLCRSKAALGSEVWDGSFAEYVVLKRQAAFRLGAAVDPLAGALVEPLAIALHALRLAALSAGDRIAILGSGNIGLMALLAARRLGLAAACIDVREDAGRLALELGAEAYVDAAAGRLPERVREALGAPPPAVLVASGHPGALDEAAAIVAPGGEVVVVSYFEGRHEIDPGRFLAGELRLLFSTLCLPADVREAIGWIEAGAVDPRPVVAQMLPLGSVARAMEIMDGGTERGGKLALTVAAEPGAAD